MPRKVQSASHQPGTRQRSAEAFPLAVELETFARVLPGLLDTCLGKYVVIKAREVIAVAEDYQQALRIGYDRFGIGNPFFVDCIEAPETARRRNRILLTKLEALKHG